MTRKLFFISLFFTLVICIQALETEKIIEIQIIDRLTNKISSDTLEKCILFQGDFKS